MSRSLQSEMELPHPSPSTDLHVSNLPVLRKAILCHGYHLSPQTATWQDQILQIKREAKKQCIPQPFPRVLHHGDACLIQQIHIFFGLSLLTTYLWKSFLLSNNPFEFQLQLRFSNVPSACLYPSWASCTSFHLLHTLLFSCLSSTSTSPLSKAGDLSCLLGFLHCLCHLRRLCWKIS